MGGKLLELVGVCALCVRTLAMLANWIYGQSGVNRMMQPCRTYGILDIRKC